MDLLPTLPFLLAINLETPPMTTRRVRRMEMTLRLIVRPGPITLARLRRLSVS